MRDEWLVATLRIVGFGRLGAGGASWCSRRATTKRVRLQDFEQADGSMAPSSWLFPYIYLLRAPRQRERAVLHICLKCMDFPVRVPTREYGINMNSKSSNFLGACPKLFAFGDLL